MSSLLGIGGGGNVGAAGGSFYSYSLDQSLRLQNGVTQSLTVSSAFPTATDRKKVTVSFWYKKGTDAPNAEHAYHNSGNGLIIQFATNDTMYLYDFGAGSGGWQVGSPTTDRLFRDPSAWYHVALILDSTQATDSDRAKLYINGELWSLSTWTVGSGASRYPSLNATFNAHTGSSATVLTIGASGLHGYVADFMSIDGQDVSISDLGETVNGVWVGKEYTGSFGNAGFHLDFADSSAIGNDVSGNNVDFTAAGFAAHDVVPDSPTNNFATLNALWHGTATYAEGNLKFDGGGFTSSLWGSRSSFAIPKDKKIYIELEETATGGANYAFGIGTDSSIPTGTNVGGTGSVTLYHTAFYINGTSTAHGQGSSVAGDIIGIAVDGSTGEVWFSRNGTWFTTGGAGADPSTGTDPIGTVTNPDDEDLFLVVAGNTSTSNLFVNFGQDSQNVASAESDANGIGTFEYAVPTDHVCLCASSLSEPAIGPNSTEQADDYFTTVLSTGDGTNATISGFGFQPDFLWHKARSVANGHWIMDSIRVDGSGDSLPLRVDSTNAEGSTVTVTLNSDGYVHLNGSSNNFYGSGQTYVDWAWKAGGTAVSNTDGSITSSVSANPDAGFSIVSWTGTGANATIGHGLASAPEMVIVKNRDTTGNWHVYHKDITDAPTHVMYLNLTNANTDQPRFNDTTPTNTVFSVNDSDPMNKSGDEIIAYCFHSVEGFSKVGKYVGNGSSTNGPFVALGFRPAFVLTKESSSTSGWNIRDNKRSPENVVNEVLQANTTTAELTSGYDVDFLSNGFKLRTNLSDSNTSGQTYIFYAVASVPFKYSNAR